MASARSASRTIDVAAAFADDTRIEIALSLAAIDALEECVRRGQQTAVWRDNRVVWADAAPLLRAERRRLARLRARRVGASARGTRRRQRRAR